MKRSAYIFLLFVLAIAASCQEPIVVPGNEAPDDPTVSNILKENYVRKSYLALLGRIPTDSEATAAFELLSAKNCSQSDRSVFLDNLFSCAEYMENVYTVANNEILAGISANEIQQLINHLQLQISNINYVNDTILLGLRLMRMEKLRDAHNEFLAGIIPLNEVHARMVNSDAHNDLVGNGEEWIKAVFSHFLLREPTEDELINCSEMMNLNSETLFMVTGSSKDDLVTIFFNSDEYFEGQVRKLFQKYLFREAGSFEVTSLAQEFKASKNYKALQKKILISDEFLGID